MAHKTRDEGNTKQNKQKNKKTQNHLCEHYYAQTNTNNVNKTWFLLQATGGIDEIELHLKAEIVRDITETRLYPFPHR